MAMHRLGLIALVVSSACGSDYNNTSDAAGPDACTDCGGVQPRIIAGGGIGDGPIDGVVNLYVIDDVSRQPITGAVVHVGTVTGATDSTGLFVAHGVTGPQTVTASSPSYRSEMWVGANGANITLDLPPATIQTVPHGTVTGTITNFGAETLPANHIKIGIVQYSADDHQPEVVNNIPTAGSTNICTSATPTCTFAITTRTGTIALVAAIYDVDTKGTPDDSDNTLAFLGWAVKTNLAVTNGATVTADLDRVAATDLALETIDFGTPPSGLGTVAAIVGIETPSSGVIQLPAFLSPAANKAAVPKLSTMEANSTYRLSAFANNGTAPGSSNAAVLRRGLTSTTLSAGAWMPAPTGVTATRTTAGWTPAAGAAVHGVTWSSTNPTGTTTNFLEISVFDTSTAVTIPDWLALPPAGALTATVQALQADIDVTNFSLDAAIVKLTGASAQTAAVP